MNKKSKSPFPTVTQILLLKASLMSGIEMQLAFEEWDSKVDFEKEIDYASFRLLPLLYNN